MKDLKDQSGGDDARDARPGLAIVSLVLTPYRLHLHKRISLEIPELKLHSIFTHGKTDFNWTMHGTDTINPVVFSSADERTGGSPFRHVFRDVRKGVQIARYIDASNIRGVIINGWSTLTTHWLIRHCRRQGIPFFVRGDSNIKGDVAKSGLRLWCKRAMLKRVFRNCDGVMPMGGLGQQFFEKYGADPEKCFWVPYEPDYRLFSTVDEAQLDAFRIANDLGSNRKYLLFSGRLIPLKRVDLLLKAFCAIADRRPDWDLIIIGDGPSREGLQAQVPGALADRIKWLGFREMSEMCLGYHAANVLVLTSEYEAWALVLNEAAAAGLVIVASDVIGAAHELVRDGHNGRVFETNNLDALTDALADVTDEAKYERYRMGVEPALRAWREKADPVMGIRRALRSVGVLP